MHWELNWIGDQKPFKVIEIEIIAFLMLRWEYIIICYIRKQQTWRKIHSNEMKGKESEFKIVIRKCTVGNRRKISSFITHIIKKKNLMMVMAANPNELYTIPLKKGYVKFFFLHSSILEMSMCMFVRLNTKNTYCTLLRLWFGKLIV